MSNPYIMFRTGPPAACTWPPHQHCLSFTAVECFILCCFLYYPNPNTTSSFLSENISFFLQWAFFFLFPYSFLQLFSETSANYSAIVSTAMHQIQPLHSSSISLNAKLRCGTVFWDLPVIFLMMDSWSTLNVMMEESHLQFLLIWLLIVIQHHVTLAFCSTDCNGDGNIASKQYNSKEPANRAFFPSILLKCTSTRIN